MRSGGGARALRASLAHCARLARDLHAEPCVLRQEERAVAHVRARALSCTQGSGVAGERVRHPLRRWRAPRLYARAALSARAHARMAHT